MVDVLLKCTADQNGSNANYKYYGHVQLVSKIHIPSSHLIENIKIPFIQTALWCRQDFREGRAEIAARKACAENLVDHAHLITLIAHAHLL